ncbi:MAG: hypothetical protein HYT71_02800 [Candidatus Aenigmarchaeota archaeon]|nr:hypothetical protein [Candidatus Aenigmarchaeota archaeon]
MNDIETLRLFRSIGKRARKITKNCDRPAVLMEKNPYGDFSLRIDIELENMVKRCIGNNTLITEERPENMSGGNVFILDPLDGSRNFSRGYPVYSLSIGAAPEGAETVKDIRVSYAINLVNGDEYHAIAGKGAFLNGKRIRSLPQKGKKLISLDIGDDYGRAPKLVRGLMRLGWLRSSGTCIMDICMAARGSTDAHVDVRNKILVTHSPVLLIAKEAGMIVTDAYGRDVSTPLENGATFSVIASNEKKLHSDILKVVRKSGPTR